ncbi:MAG: adenylyltransferase/cytidyltransferase family protein [Paludibacteraceae bacterium]|nr:adenylyltransferase/cytidyltransferase family protein [Paludibacteraceae bacterium]
MAKGKIRLLQELPSIVNKHKKRGKTIGLITGCFDILHIGHIELFQSAKSQVDILIVGVENDETIKRSKGANRPVNNQDNRLRFLEAVQYIDYVFLVTDTFDYNNDKEATKIHNNILKTISPHFLITNKKADKYWKNKEKRANKFGIKLLDINYERSNSTTKIVEHLLSEL